MSCEEERGVQWACLVRLTVYSHAHLFFNGSLLDQLLKKREAGRQDKSRATFYKARLGVCSTTTDMAIIDVEQLDPRKHASANIRRPLRQARQMRLRRGDPRVSRQLPLYHKIPNIPLQPSTYLCCLQKGVALLLVKGNDLRAEQAVSAAGMRRTCGSTPMRTCFVFATKPSWPHSRRILRSNA